MSDTFLVRGCGLSHCHQHIAQTEISVEWTVSGVGPAVSSPDVGRMSPPSLCYWKTWTQTSAGKVIKRGEEKVLPGMS